MTGGALTAATPASYASRRAWIEQYFDRTAADTWARLTSDAPVGRIRASVRAGRDRMRQILSAWLPEDLRGIRILDAGCGTGALAVELARRGAEVVAVDLSPTLVDLARQRVPADLGEGRVEFRSGDMLSSRFGRFHHVVAMDSLIHYQAADAVAALAELAGRTERSILFTFAPRTAMLAAMHAMGQWFPRGQRSPAIEPVAEAALRRRLAGEPALRGWQIAWSGGVQTAFYRSQAVAFVRARG
jgi:magnesium-protoporphyrin O-methyltransferase